MERKWHVLRAIPGKESEAVDLLERKMAEEHIYVIQWNV